MTALGLIRGLLVFILSKMVNSGKYCLKIIFKFTSLSLFTLVTGPELKLPTLFTGPELYLPTLDRGPELWLLTLVTGPELTVPV